MKPTRTLSRRSFLGTVAGGSIAGAAAIVLASTEAQALQTDSDTGRNADRPGHGRQGGGRARSGITDRDSGRGADSPGNGRGRRSGRSGPTDSDRGSGADSPGNGRGRRRACTDSDSGRNSDQPGHGRRC